ncbi:GFA family protein [Fulvimarina sp. MAC8]|uniref:GFA family protein n=1 Tax=Fulvimarina sp. MAC8 TaxID=3162874 RepID=UPI0032ED489C
MVKSDPTPNDGAAIEGGCRCGRVRFKVKGRPLVTTACHCTGCQKMTASAFSLSSLYATEAFELTSGETVIGGLHGEARHHFCDHCKSWLFSYHPKIEGFVNVRATMLEDAATYEPFIETYTSEMLPWARTPALHSFEKFPPPGEFSALMAEFASSAG